VYFRDLRGRGITDYTFNYFPTAAGTYYAVAVDVLDKRSARSALITFGASDDSDFDGISDRLAELLGFPPTNALGIPVSVMLRMGYNLRLTGETPPAGAFSEAARGRQLLEALAGKGLVTIVKTGQMDFDALEAVAAMREATEILQLDYKARSGVGMIGQYLVFFDSAGERFTFRDAISLADVLPLGEGQRYISLISADGNLLVLARWDGQRAVDDLLLMDVQNRIFAAVNGSDGSARFDLDAAASQLAFARDRTLTLLNLVSGEVFTDDAAETNALSFNELGALLTGASGSWNAALSGEQKLLLSVRDGWRTSLVDGIAQDEPNTAFYFTTQRGVSPQTVFVPTEDQGELSATFDGRLFLDAQRRQIYAALPMALEKVILYADGRIGE
jgi:hypothetical protein